MLDTTSFPVYIGFALLTVTSEVFEVNRSEQYADMKEFKAPLVWGTAGMALLFGSEWAMKALSLSFDIRVGLAIIQLLPMAACLYTFARCILAQDELKKRIMSEAIVLGSIGTVFLGFAYAALQRMHVWSPDWTDMGAWLAVLFCVAFQFTKKKYA